MTFTSQLNYIFFWNNSSSMVIFYFGDILKLFTYHGTWRSITWWSSIYHNWVNIVAFFLAVCLSVSDIFVHRNCTVNHEMDITLVNHKLYTVIDNKVVNRGKIQFTYFLSRCHSQTKRHTHCIMLQCNYFSSTSTNKYIFEDQRQSQ